MKDKIRAVLDEFYNVNKVTNGTTTNFPTARAVYNGPDRDNNVTYRWWDTGTTYGNISVVIEEPPIAHARIDATGTYTIDVSELGSLDWGEKFHFLIWKRSFSDENEYFEVDARATNVNTQTTDYLDLILTFEDPEPSLPVIKLEADTDYRSSIVTMTSKPSDKDIVEFATIWKDGGTDTFENKLGVFYSSTNRVQHSGGSQFATGIFKEVDGDNSQSLINTTVQNMLARDSMALREEIKRLSPDIQLTQTVDIGGETVEVEIPMTVGFFWPDSAK